MSSLAVLAGFTSTVIFAGATLPMLRKAVATRDLRSYSLGNIGLANLGNAVHSIYVLNLPPGPIWVLHAFYVLSSGLMLVWYLRFRHLRPPPVADEGVGSAAQSRSRSSKGAADSSSGPSSVITTCSSSLTPSAPPTSPM